MRIAHLSIMALTAAAVFVAGTSAIIAQSRGQGRPLLFPLSGQDQEAAHGSGCQLSFDAGRSTFVYVIGHDFMIKTGTGRAVCHISDAQFAALSEGGTQSCQGLRLTIRQTGQSVGHQESDSASAPATLTVAGGGRTWSARGHWGSAC
jgi:hypothetical protein